MSRSSTWLAIAGLIAGCAGVADPLPDQDSDDLAQQTVQLPDGRVVTLTGVRRGDSFAVGDMLFPLPRRGPRAAAIPAAQRWPSQTIRYAFTSGVDAGTRQKVASATAPWTAAGFTFVEVPATTFDDHVEIRVGTGEPWICGATVGFQGLDSHYNAAPNCTTHDYIHEWGHALGLLHEHERTDRDEYIEVDTNVDDSLKTTIAGRGDAWFDYDLDSIMHYDAYMRNSTDGSVDMTRIRIRPRDGRPLNGFGFTTLPSYYDLATLRCMYTTGSPVPLYQLYSPQYQDWFYTIDPSQRAIAMQQYGYVDYGIAARVEPGPIGDALPFRRLYKGPPQTDHFYTTSLDELTSAQLFGWQPESVEGYLHTDACPNRRPLFRFSHWDGATSDLMHFYTIDGNIRSTLESQGWLFEGSAGNVHAP